MYERIFTKKYIKVDKYFTWVLTITEQRKRGFSIVDLSFASPASTANVRN